MPSSVASDLTPLLSISAVSSPESSPITSPRRRSHTSPFMRDNGFESKGSRTVDLDEEFTLDLPNSPSQRTCLYDRSICTPRTQSPVPSLASDGKSASPSESPKQGICALPRNRPYPSRVGEALLTLDLAPSAHLPMAARDIEKNMIVLHSALSRFPDDLVLRAYEAKRADRDLVVHQVAQTVAEIECVEKHRVFLSAIKQHQEHQLEMEEATLETVKALLSPCSLREMEDENGFYRAVFAEQLVALTLAETQLEPFGSQCAAA